MSPRTRRRRARALRLPAVRLAALRAVVGWAVLVVLLWVVGGLVGAVLGAVLAAWHLVRPPAPRTLLAGAVVALGLVPVVWVVANGELLGVVTADLVTEASAPGVLALVGLSLLAVGVQRDVAARHRGGQRPPGPAVAGRHAREAA